MFPFPEGRSEYWILYDYMLYNKNTYLHTSPAAGGYTVDIEQMGGYITLIKEILLPWQDITMCSKILRENVLLDVMKPS